MRDVLRDLRRWYEAGEPAGLVTVVSTFHSAPRAPGAVMAVSASGTVIGSVSGGCVESAVYELACEVMTTGRPVLQSYGISTDDAIAVGLTCGGTIQVLVEPFDAARFPEFPAVAASIESGEPVAVATLLPDPEDAPPSSGSADGGRAGAHLVVWPDRAAGSLGSARLDDAVTADTRGMLEAGHTGVLCYGPEWERRGDRLGVFVQVFAPPPRLIVFGAIDFAGAVARIGRFLGYRVTVCDARPVFATPERFPDADEVVVDWPHRYLERTPVDERTAICVLTHDPKFDVPLLKVALRTRAGYVGAMGSRRTHAERLRQLREEGLTEAELARLRSPIGLDIGGLTPEETAVSIAAEIVATRWGGTGRPLSETRGPIHHAAVPTPS